MSPVSHFDKQEKQAQPYSQFLGKYSFHINQISSRAYTGIEVFKYHKICLGKITFWPWVLKTSEASLKKNCKIENFEGPVFGSKRLEIENISFRSIFDHLLFYLHLIDSVLANEFDEI